MAVDSKEPLLFKVFLALFLICALVTNIGSLVYVKLKLKLNEHLLKILKLHLVIVVGSILASSLGFILAYIDGNRNLYTCSLYMLPIGAGFVSSYLFPTAIAVVRYHMASKAAKQKYFKHHHIAIVVGIAVLLECLVILGMFVPTFFYQEPFGPVLEACYKSTKTSSNKLQFGPPFALVTAVFALVIGIGYDLAMLRFLKQRRSIKPVLELVSWNQHHQPPIVSQGSNDKSSKGTVPIQATCLGVVNLCVVLVYFYVLVFGMGQEEYLTYFMLSGGIGCLIVHMPLVLLLTVKSNEKKYSRTIVAPPTELQFHDNH